MYRGHVFRFAVVAALSLAAVVVSTQVAAAQQMMQPRTSQEFSVVKVNGGTVTEASVNGRIVLTLSDDFKVPDSPDPHWQVVDSQGNVYALNRLQAKNNKFNKSTTLPSYRAAATKEFAADAVMISPLPVSYFPRLSPQGKRLGIITGPEHPHNKTLYLCAQTGLYRIRLNVADIRP